MHPQISGNAPENLLDREESACNYGNNADLLVLQFHIGMQLMSTNRDVRIMNDECLKRLQNLHTCHLGNLVFEENIEGTCLKV